jgi:ketosteroid isomerase-like protein
MKQGLILILLIALFAAAQNSPDASVSETKILALENAWGQAEKLDDSKALNTLLDDSLVYIRYDGSLWSKAQYLASLNDRSSHEEQAVNENMTAHVYGDIVLVTGIYRVKGVEKGKPYSRKERFIDTWVQRKGVWTCVASQVTLISH